MSSRYGIKIYHRDGTTFTINNDSTLTRMCGTTLTGQVLEGNILLDNRGVADASYPTGITVPPGYEWMITLSQSVWFDWGRVYDTVNSAPGGYTRVSARLDADRQVIIDYHYTHRIYYVNGHGTGDEHIFGKIQCQVISWPVRGADTGRPPHRYGIAVGGLDNLQVVPDAGQVSHLHFKGDIDIHDGWTPSEVDPALTMNNCICFFYTTDPDLVIGLRFGAARYSVWGKQNGKYGVSMGKVRVRVCIFANLPPGPPERYGLSVYNKGKLIYNSTQDPLIRPAKVDMSGGFSIDGNGGGFKRDAVTSPFRYPMYAPAAIGAAVGAMGEYNGSDPKAGNMKATTSTYVTSNGHSLYHGYGGREADIYGDYPDLLPPAYNYPEVITSRLPVLVIDGENHFTF
ncbi:hypothetical protein ODD70_004551 [Salmonella enterica]|nr:hypothetical protein [Salmonella enterica]EJX0553913.1 hypothetical protein [Salmonella enterica]EJX0602061.1 hypothetical protein [Salmonella enterica]EJX0850246.1 hypothetical protein [Salmonella enterica]